MALRLAPCHVVFRLRGRGPHAVLPTGSSAPQRGQKCSRRRARQRPSIRAFHGALNRPRSQLSEQHAKRTAQQEAEQRAELNPHLEDDRLRNDQEELLTGYPPARPEQSLADRPGQRLREQLSADYPRGMGVWTNQSAKSMPAADLPAYRFDPRDTILYHAGYL
jgi:hypothetical protein